MQTGDHTLDDLLALSLTQPYALLTVRGKRIETRSWSTQYRGKLAIHAATSLTPVGGVSAYRNLCQRSAFWRALKFDMRKSVASLVEDPMLLPFGAIVAVVDVFDIVPVDTVAMYHNRQTDAVWYVPPGNVSDEYAFGDYSPGRFAWLLDSPVEIKAPVTCRGYQKLWSMPDDVRTAVVEQYRAATGLMTRQSNM